MKAFVANYGIYLLALACLPCCKEAPEEKLTYVTFYPATSDLGKVTVNNPYGIDVKKATTTKTGKPGNCSETGYANFYTEAGWQGGIDAKSDMGYTWKWDNDYPNAPLIVEDIPCNYIELTKENSQEANCPFSVYNGSQACSNPDYVAVKSGKCCPSYLPFYVEDQNGNGGCFESCSKAQEWAQSSTGISYGNKSGCYYIQVYYFPNSCGSNFTPVMYGPDRCCPKTKPFYCNATDECYSTCEEAKAACNGGAPYKGPL